jgi:Fur family transcriptional regulator, zinc uptake regulator
MVRIKPPTPEVVSQQLAEADTLCQERGSNLTPLRREVLELVIRQGRPVGAYELLDVLRTRGRSSSPPTVYRALEFLQQEGLVHRLPAQNAFMACSHPHHHHQGLIFTCTRCGQALELETPDLFQMLENYARPHGFEVSDDSLEISGVCPFCRESGS